MKKLLSLLLLLSVFTICFAQQTDDGPVWAWLDKLYFIPIILIIGAAYSYYRGYKQSKSGSVDHNNIESDINIPFYKCSATYFGYILTAATIGFYIWQYFEK